MSVDIRRFIGHSLPQQYVFIFAIQQVNETDIDGLSDYFRLGQIMPEGGSVSSNLTVVTLLVFPLFIFFYLHLRIRLYSVRAYAICQEKNSTA
jgi:hypothetical protein